MNRFFRYLILSTYLSLCAVLPFYNCTQQVTGTEVGNPATVMGKVYDVDNNLVANAAVFLVRPDYNPVLDTIAMIDALGNDSQLNGVMIVSDDMKRISTRTNSDGEFILDSVAPNTYNLFITDSGSGHIGFKPDILVNEKQFDLGTCKIRSVGYAKILVADSIFELNGTISITGTPIKKAVDSAGQYTLPIIDDSMTINYYNKSGDTLSVIFSNSQLSEVNAGDTIDLTGTETIIIPPVLGVIIENDTLFHTIDTIDDDSLIRIVATGASINKNSFLEYQFYETTQKTLSAWSTENVYSLLTKSGIEYSIACRVRDRSNPSIVTTWTSGLLIRIRKSVDSVFLPSPYAPIPLDTFPFTDSISYRFLLRDSADIDTGSFTLDYRLRWNDTTELSGFSSWVADSISSISFPGPGIYEIRAQTRSAADTSQMSLWSDSLIFTVTP